MSDAIELSDIEPGTGRSHGSGGGTPKGIAPYRVYAKKKVLVDHILDVFGALEAADALPVGPRQVGYRLKEEHGYTKDDFIKIAKTIKRLTQAGEVPWAWASDSSALLYDVGGYATLAEFMADMPGMYAKDLRAGQPTVVEVYAEARDALPLIRRVAAERGVSVYSGGGCTGPQLARRVASRALARAVEHEQSTLILGLCDFDFSGVRDVIRPHVEHVSAFLYGTDGNEHVLSYAGKTMIGIEHTCTFCHLALTPELARQHIDGSTAALDAYAASGDDLWSRDVNLLKVVQKVELEALDPAELRRLVVEAIDDVIDPDALQRAVEAGVKERERLRRLAV